MPVDAAALREAHLRASFCDDDKRQFIRPPVAVAAAAQQAVRLGEEAVPILALGLRARSDDDQVVGAVAEAGQHGVGRIEKVGQQAEVQVRIAVGEKAHLERFHQRFHAGRFVLVPPSLMTGDSSFAHQATSHMSPDTMPLGLQLLGKGARACGRSGFLVMLDQHGFEFLPLRLHLALALTPGIKAAAANIKHTATVVNAV